MPLPDVLPVLPLVEPLWSELELLLCFLCFFLPVLVSVELFWSEPVPDVPLALEEPLDPVPDWPLMSELDPVDPLPLVEPDEEEPVPDWLPVEPVPELALPEDCAAAIPIEKRAAVAIARSFLDICVS